MRRIFSPNVLWVCVALFGVIFLGVLVGMVGDNRRVLALIVSSFGLLMIVLISKRSKFGLLALSIPLSLLRIPTLPALGFSLSGIILMALTADELLRAFSGHGMNGKPLKPGMLISFGLFAFAGLITALVSGELHLWPNYFLIPFLWLFLSSKKILNQKEAWLLIKLSLLTILGFIAIATWANLTGHFKSLAIGSTDSSWRFGYGYLVKLGPIQLTIWATFLGSIAALGFPACILLWIEKKGERWWRMGALFILAGLGSTLFFAAARGAIVGAFAGSLLAILASGKLLSPKLLGAFALLLVVVAIWGTTFLEMLPEQNILRIQTILQGTQQDLNFQIRKGALELAWKLTLQNPLGVGFGYLWNTYGIDDAIIYANILEGSGILGSIAFLMIVVQLAFKFVLIIIKSSVGFIRDFASIGLGTLIVGLVAGISSQSILFEPVHSFVFWAIIMAAYHGVKSQD